MSGSKNKVYAIELQPTYCIGLIWGVILGTAKEANAMKRQSNVKNPKYYDEIVKMILNGIAK